MISGREMSSGGKSNGTGANDGNGQDFVIFRRFIVKTADLKKDARFAEKDG
jgi:hypothetical protein